MNRNFLRLFAALIALVLVTAACGDDATEDDAADSTEAAADAETTDDAMEEDEAMDEDAMDDDAMDEESHSGTIVEIAAADGSFTTLVAAVEAAGLVDTLSGDGPFTVFAPTDDAFAAALDSLGLTAEELLADTETLSAILTYHVVADAVASDVVVTLDGQSVATVNGAEVTVSVDGETVMVNDATVTAVDISASNGVIHVIDSVLLPPEG